MHDDSSIVRSAENQPHPKVSGLGRPADVFRLFKKGDPVVCRRLHRLAYALSREHLSRNGCASGLQHQEAEDVVQEVICRLLTFQYDERVDAVVETVILGYVRRVWYETLRERSRMSLVEPEAAGLARLPDNWMAAVERQLVEEAVLQAFRFDVKPRCRVVFDLRYFLGKTIADIAGALKLSILGVDSRLRRCRKLLKGIVKNRLATLYREAESSGQYF